MFFQIPHECAFVSQGNNMIYYQPQSYIIIRYKVVCAEFLGSVFSSKLSMVLIMTPFIEGMLDALYGDG